MSADYDKLPLVDRKLAEVGASPRISVYVATGAAVLVGWLWIVLQTSGVAQFTPAALLGPGMIALQPVLDWIGELASQYSLLESFIRLCVPQWNDTKSLSAFLPVLAMWFAMCVAMMLPSAAPMFRTYGDIAQTAKSKGETTVPLYVLASGYLSVWFVYAFLAALLQVLFVSYGVLNSPIGVVHTMAGGGVLLLAGAYQFSSLKHACLEKCRNPFTTLFSQWSTSSTKIFKLGVEQGLYCIGCCWALMLVMFVVGSMNLAWMAFFTLFAIVEKSGKGKVTSALSGVILLIWGGILLSISLVASW